MDPAFALEAPGHDAGELVARRIQSLRELAQMWLIDRDGYGEANLPWVTYYRWWSACPIGVTVIFDGPKLVGGAGMWPIHEDSADRLLSGALRECEIGPQDFVSPSTARTWYRSGTILLEPWRGGLALPTLLSESCAAAAALCEDPDATRAISLGYSDQGIRLASALGLRATGTNSLDDLPIYLAPSSALPTMAEHAFEMGHRRLARLGIKEARIFNSPTASRR